MPRTEGVHRRSVQVAGRVLHLPDAIPALVHREEGVLRELFGFEPVPRHQAERLEEPCPLVFEEEIELQGLVAAASCGCRLSLEMDGVVPHVGS